MSGRHAPKPSPLAGEGAERRRREAGEGAFAVWIALQGTEFSDPSPLPALRAGTPLPQGERGRSALLVRRATMKRRVNERTTGAPASPTTEVPIARARALRVDLTNAERKLWYALRDRRFAGYKFRRQVPVGPYIADFLCYSARLVIEVDGGQHAESARDARRDRWLAENGFRVLRFWNNEVLQNLEGVWTVIFEALQPSTPHPARVTRGRPSPARGEGTEQAARAEQKR